MRDPKRITEILDLLDQVWSVNPDLRFFQFVEFLKMKISYGMGDYFFFEDDNLIKELKDILKSMPPKH